MTWKQARAAAVSLMAELPPLPRPWRIEDLCTALAGTRGRPLLLHELDVAALPFGLWYFDGERDHIISRAGATGYHRDHIILHEICHMIAGHNTAPAAAGADVMTTVIEAAMAAPHTADQEELAEAFATVVLRQARKRPPGGEFEQRVSAVFGAA